MRNVTQEFLDSRKSKFYPVQKWIEFCETLIREGYKLKLYEAKTTRSKYILVNGCFKVRFSNHRPSYLKQKDQDSDFYVGVSNFGTTTTQDALQAVRRKFAHV